MAPASGDVGPAVEFFQGESWQRIRAPFFLAAATLDCCDGDAVPLTQEFLGQMLGVRRITVTIAARLLQSAGMIRYRRGNIQVLDGPALEASACECYAVVRRNIDDVLGPAIPPR